ncbi:MAG: VWA domain-containing protein, partial [Polyangiaceae bacterium]
MRLDAMTRVLDELLWSARREGIEISTVQAIDAARAAHLVGMEDRQTFRDALASVLTSSRLDARRFDRAFDAFFSRKRDAADLWERLTQRGFSEAEQDALRELLDEVAAAMPDAALLSPLLHRGADLEQLLRSSSIARTFDSMQSPMQAGFFAHRAMERIGMESGRSAIASLRARLREAFGERGDALADFLEAELALAADDVRAHVQRNFSRREELRTEHAGDLDSRQFTS